MAYGTVVRNLSSPSKGLSAVMPGSNTGVWQDIIEAGTGGIITANSAGELLNPETLTSTKIHPIDRDSKGTNLLLRVKYSSASTVTASPIFKVFGRTGSDAWDALPSRGGNLLEKILCDPATDVTDASFNYSQIDFTLALSWDCLGCEQFIVLVQTAIAGSAMTTATLQAKIL